jgi:hypothetical protein
MKLKLPRRSDFHSKDDYEVARIAVKLANLALKHGASLQECIDETEREFGAWNRHPLQIEPKP